MESDELTEDYRGREKYHVVLGGLVLASLVAVYIVFYEPVLHVDDWGQTVYRRYLGQLTWFVPTSRRPLNFAAILFVYSLFGDNIAAFYAITGAFTIIASLQLYVLMIRLLPEMPTVALLVSAVFLLYPVDYTRMYITMLHIRMGVFFVLLYALLLVVFIDSRSRYRGILLLLALVCLVLSFGFYEGQWGIALAYAVFLTLYKGNKWSERIALLSPILPGLLFAWWRTLGMQSVGASDHFLQKVEFAVGVLVSRVIVGLRVLIIAWTEPVTRLLGTEEPAVGLLIVYAMVAFTLFAAKWFITDQRRDRSDEKMKAGEITKTLLLAATGGVFAIAGYLPVIILYTPTLNGRASRINLFASFGAAIVLVALLRLIALLLAQKRAHAARLLTVITLPFLTLGLVTQAWVQYDANIAWEEQKQIWRGLFEVAPDLEPNTAVYILMPGYQERYSLVDWRRAPLSASWEVSAALRVLYDDNSLDGDIILPDLPFPQAELTRDGIVNSYTGEEIGYQNALFVRFDQETQSVRVIKDLSDEFSLKWRVDAYAPMRRIAKAPTSMDSPWHRLIFSE